MAAPEYLSDTDGGALVRVRVTPRSSRTEIAGPREKVVRVEGLAAAELGARLP